MIHCFSSFHYFFNEILSYGECESILIPGKMQ
jgi:hypothetical protein